MKTRSSPFSNLKPLYYIAVLTVSLAISIFVGTVAHAAPGDPITIPDANFKTCLLTQVTHSNPTYITEAEAAAKTGLLGCAGSSISNLTGIEYFTSISGLYVYHNDIVDLSPLVPLASNLTTLNVSCNDVEDTTPLASLTNLEDLSIYACGSVDDQNLLNNADLSTIASITSLTSLTIFGYQFTDISALAGLTNLEALAIGGANAPLPFLDFSQLSDLSNLQVLDAGYVRDNSQIAAFTTLVNLTSLSFAGAPTGTNLSVLSSLSNLESLSLSYINAAAFATISGLAGMPNLDTLHIRNGWPGFNYVLTDLSPLSTFTGLTRLSVDGAAVIDISALSGLTGLTELSLGGNRIADISPLAGLTNLTSLGLTSQRLALPDLTAGSSQANPLRGLAGGFIVPTGADLVYDNGGNTWAFSSAGAKTATWSQPVSIGGANGFFTGTITQVSAGPGDNNAPRVPNTGAFNFITKNPLVTLVLGILSAAFIIFAIARLKRRA